MPPRSPGTALAESLASSMNDNHGHRSARTQRLSSRVNAGAPAWTTSQPSPGQTRRRPVIIMGRHARRHHLAAMEPCRSGAALLLPPPWWPCSWPPATRRSRTHAARPGPRRQTRHGRARRRKEEKAAVISLLVNAAPRRRLRRHSRCLPTGRYSAHQRREPRPSDTHTTMSAPGLDRSHKPPRPRTAKSLQPAGQHGLVRRRGKDVVVRRQPLPRPQADPPGAGRLPHARTRPGHDPSPARGPSRRRRRGLYSADSLEHALNRLLDYQDHAHQRSALTTPPAVAATAASAPQCHRMGGPTAERTEP